MLNVCENNAKCTPNSDNSKLASFNDAQCDCDPILKFKGAYCQFKQRKFVFISSVEISSVENFVGQKYSLAKTFDIC